MVSTAHGTAAAMSAALAAFAHDEGIDAQHRVVLLLDGAGWHTASTLVPPDGLELATLPPVSPELQPVERLGSLLDEPVANRAFADLDALEAVSGPARRPPDRQSPHPLSLVAPRTSSEASVIIRIPY